MDDLIFINESLFEECKNSEYGTDPFNRSIEELIEYGFINLDKPAGPTSHDVVSTVKKILNIDKAGHSGTLDPQVTGVLPIGLLKSTKILSSLLKAPKRYICNMYSEDNIEKETLHQIFTEFTNLIFQVPPLKSNVVKKLRKRNIYDIELLEIQDNHTLFSVKSEAGTYIRTLCVDIGRATGIYSYMKELRRVQTGPFREEDIVTLHDLFDVWENYKEDPNNSDIRSIIKPVETSISHLPFVVVNDSAVDSICHGSDLMIPGILAYSIFTQSDLISILSSKGELIGLGTSYIESNSMDNSKTGRAVHPTRVIMKRGTYPRYQKK